MPSCASMHHSLADVPVIPLLHCHCFIWFRALPPLPGLLSRFALSNHLNGWAAMTSLLCMHTGVTSAQHRMGAVMCGSDYIAVDMLGEAFLTEETTRL